MENIKSWKSFNEGKTMKALKSNDMDVKIGEFRDKVEEFLKNYKDLKVRVIGSDLEVKKENIKIQIMFRRDYISIKSEGDKPINFKYNELGKIKAKIKELINKK